MIKNKLTKHVFNFEGSKYVFWQAGRSSNLPIVMIHGLTGSHDGLVPLADRLLAGHKIIMPDLPGHGESDPAKELSLEWLSDWLTALIDFVDHGQKVNVISHSFGGAVAARALAKNPNKINKVVLLNPVYAVGRLTRHYHWLLVHLPSKVSKWLDENKSVRKFKRNFILVRRGPSNIKVLDRLDALDHPDKIRAQYFVDLSQVVEKDQFYQSALKDLNPNALICIEADHDKLVGKKDVQNWRKLLGNDRVLVCKQSGHLMPIEAPGDVAKKIKNILD